MEMINDALSMVCLTVGKLGFPVYIYAQISWRDSVAFWSRTYASKSFVRFVNSGFTHRGNKNGEFCFLQEVFHLAGDTIAKGTAVHYDHDLFLGCGNLFHNFV